MKLHKKIPARGLEILIICTPYNLHKIGFGAHVCV